MTTKDGKYPNKKDLEPKIYHPHKGMAPADELPLSDPSDSNYQKEFRENAQDETGEHMPSAYSETQTAKNDNYHELKPGERFPFGDQEEYNKRFNKTAHKEWNDHKEKNPVETDDNPAD